MKFYAGLGLSMASTEVCVVDQEGKPVHFMTVDSTLNAIVGALAEIGAIERAVIETGRMSPAICLGLKRLGAPIMCIDARQAHQSLKAMKANKTDLNDG